MMEVSLFGGVDANTVDAVVEVVATAAEDGFEGVWFPQIWGLDTLTALAVAAREVPAIHLGTAVVPIQGRHPIPLAQQALTVVDAGGPGRFTVGLGVTHAPFSEGWYGIPYAGVVELCRQELEALSPLLADGRQVEFTGSRLTARVALSLRVTPPGLVLAAMGPKMLELAGRLTDGTVTYMTGARTLGRDVVPPLRHAAAAAGRPEPRVVVGLPVCVTDDVVDARRRIGAGLADRALVATYRRMLAAEGASHPVDIALIGDEEAVGQRMEELITAGATELLAHVEGNPDEQRRTREFLCSDARP